MNRKIQQELIPAYWEDACFGSELDAYDIEQIFIVLPREIDIGRLQDQFYDSTIDFGECIECFISRRILI